MLTWRLLPVIPHNFINLGRCQVDDAAVAARKAAADNEAEAGICLASISGPSIQTSLLRALCFSKMSQNLDLRRVLISDPGTLGARIRYRNTSQIQILHHFDKIYATLCL